MPNGILQLRHGFTKPAISAVSASPIHSAAYYELHSGVRQVLFGQGADLKRHEVGATGTVTTLGTLSNSNPWNGVFADNRFIFGNNGDEKIYDGANLYDAGIRLPTSGETASISVSYSTAATGSWSTTTFSGFQLFMSYYDPVLSKQVGNRVQIGSRLTIGSANGSVVVTGLPSLAGVNATWVKLLARTHDGGQVPYAFVDATGTYLVVGNTATTATFTRPDVDANSELPTRNGLPPNFDKIAWALGRAYVINEDDPSAVNFSESAADIPSGLFVGRPEQSWPGSNKTFFPTGERCRGIHEIDNEPWVWTRNHLAILSEFGGSQSSLGKPLVRWRGTWVGGLAGQRAFAKTPYGPFWVSADKELMTRGPRGPTPVSREYEAGLLARISDANLPAVELAYVLDPEKEIDCLHIWGKDANGAAVHIVHDFAVGGMGREHAYTGLALNTFVRNPQHVVSMRDASGKMRLWAADTAGQFNQLEDGDSDAGATYSSDLIGVFNAGPLQPTLGGLEWFGDSAVKVTVSPDLRLTLAELGALDSLPAMQVDERVSLQRVQVEEKAQYMIARVQLDSHHLDGTLARSSPVPGLPLETYGRVYLARPEMGAPRTLGGSRP